MKFPSSCRRGEERVREGLYLRNIPHPNLLPEGEGTFNIHLNMNITIIF